jgi:hypothetical protein
MDARENRPPDICLYEFCVAELYNGERNHQGKGNILLFPSATTRVDSGDSRVRYRERLGGLLRFYHQEAA